MFGRFDTPPTVVAFGEGQAELHSVHSLTARRRTGDEDGVFSYAESDIRLCADLKRQFAAFED